MGRSLMTKGYFSAPGSKPEPCELSLSLDGYGKSENLTVDCKGAYRVTLPYHPIERMALDARWEMERGSAGVKEPSVRLEGHDRALRAVKVTVWLRTNGIFEMLTVEQDRQGQISIPYSAVEKLVRSERSTQA